MSNNINTELLERGAEIIDTYPDTELAKRVEQAIIDNDLEELYYLIGRGLI